jgi:hypothetical protein
VRVRNFRASDEEYAAYVEAAGELGFSAWVRRELNESAAAARAELAAKEEARLERDRLKAALRGE